MRIKRKKQKRQPQKVSSRRWERTPLTFLEIKTSVCSSCFRLFDNQSNLSRCSDLGKEKIFPLRVGFEAFDSVRRNALARFCCHATTQIFCGGKRFSPKRFFGEISWFRVKFAPVASPVLLLSTVIGHCFFFFVVLTIFGNFSKVFLSSSCPCTPLLRCIPSIMPRDKADFRAT